MRFDALLQSVFDGGTWLRLVKQFDGIDLGSLVAVIHFGGLCVAAWYETRHKNRFLNNCLIMTTKVVELFLHAGEKPAKKKLIDIEGFLIAGGTKERVTSSTPAETSSTLIKN
jgi:hypothetical protein